MTIRNTLIAGLALAALGAGAAQAQTAVQGTVNITGEVADRCQFTLASAVIPLGELTQNDGTLDPAVVEGETVNLAGWCNGTAATISVESFPIVNTTYTGGTITGFTDTVHYTGTASANSVDVADSSSDEGGSDPEAVGVFVGNIAVTLSNASATGKLIAGEYDGSVVVTLTPNISFGGESEAP